MEIVVCVKSAIDEAELKADSSGRPQLNGASRKMSTFDKNAVEEAIRQKESKAGSVTLVYVGPQDMKTVREALAMGADKAYVVPTNDSLVDAMATSYLLAKCIAKMTRIDLVLCSEGASDTYQGQIGALVADWLSFPFLAYARKVEIAGTKVKCEQVFEDRVEISEANLPAVVSVVSEINQPRYPTLLQIMQASKKPIEEIQMTALTGEDYPQTGVRLLDTKVQSVSRKQIIFEDSPAESVQKLVTSLKREGIL